MFNINSSSKITAKIAIRGIAVNKAALPKEAVKGDVYVTSEEGEVFIHNGTVWKSFAKLRINNHNLKLSCVDCDWGVGLIQKSKSDIFKYSKNLTYNFLEMNRAKILNLISVNYFIENY